MFISYIELHGYERFMLNQIATLKMTMTEIVQVILGTNGSGKSSLVEELTPLPPDKDKFIKGGYKIVHVNHNGDQYVLTSKFVDGQEHSIIKNGVEELNPGRTVTEQREMVKKLFKITPDLHALMMDQEKFTTMSPARRREWLTKLNNNNYQYSIGVFKKVMERHRDTIGAINNVKERLTQEAAKRIDEETIREIRRKLKELTQESQKLYVLKNTDVADSHTVGERVNEQSKIIKDLDKQFRTLRKSFVRNSEYSHAEIDETIQALAASLNSTDGKYASASSAYMELADKMRTVESAEGLSIPELVKDIAAHQEKIAAIKERCTKNVAYDDPVSALDALMMSYETLVAVFTNLPPDPNALVNKQAYDELLLLIDTQTAALAEFDKGIDNCKHKLEHYDQLKQAGSVSCPSCNFSWIVNFDQEDYDKTGKLHAQYCDKVVELKASIARNKEMLKDMVVYQKTIDPYLQISRHNRPLAKLCAYINSTRAVKTSPRQVLTILAQERHNLEQLKTAVAYEKEVSAMMHSLQLARSTKMANVEMLRSQLAKLEEQIGALAIERSELSVKLEAATSYRKKLMTFASFGEQLDAAAARLESTMAEFADAIRNEQIDLMLQQTHTTIAQLQSNLTEIESQEALVADLQYQMSGLQLDEQAWRALGKALSPVDGLIAEGMLGFIRRYVATMNSLIEKVWTYPMSVKDCSLDEATAELNYKFPLYIANQPKPRKDVLKSSSGQRDMVDLAFKITAMYRSGLEGYPLVLDEFGASFDEEHRDATVRVITDIVDQLGFKQIFMISHYESCWGAFPKAQICVLDKKNITLPKRIEYNKHLEIIQ